MTQPHEDELPLAIPPVVVEYKQSSTKGGGEGYRVVTTSEATDEDVERAAWAAEEARRHCREVIAESANRCPACESTDVSHDCAATRLAEEKEGATA